MKLFSRFVVFKKSVEGPEAEGPEEENPPKQLSVEYTPEIPVVHPLVEKLNNAKDNASVITVLKEYAASPQHRSDIPDFQAQCVAKVKTFASPSVASPSVASRPPATAPLIPEADKPRLLRDPETIVSRIDTDSGDPNHRYVPHGNVREQYARKIQKDAVTKLLASGYFDKRSSPHIVDKLLEHQHSHDKPYGINQNISGLLGSFDYDGKEINKDNVFDWIETLIDDRYIKTNPDILPLLANHADYRAKLKAVIDKSPELATAIQALVNPSGQDLEKLIDFLTGEDITDEEKTLLNTISNPVIARARQLKGQNKSLSSWEHANNPTYTPEDLSVYDDASPVDIDLSDAPDYGDYPDPEDRGHGVDRYEPYDERPRRVEPRTEPARNAPEADIWIPALEKTVKDPSISRLPNLAAKMQTAIAHAKTGDIKSMMSAYFDAITSSEFLLGNTNKIRERVDKEMRGEDSSELRNEFQSFDTFVRLLLRDKFKMELSTPEGIWSQSQRGKPMKYVLTGTEDGKEQQLET